MEKKKIALSLPYTYLSGKSVSRRDRLLNELFGAPEKLLSQLAPLLSGIEISSFNTEAPEEAIEASIQKIWEHKLEVITHAYLPEEITGGSITDVYPWFAMFPTHAPSHQDHLMINIHALSSKTVDTRHLLEKSIVNLKQISLLMQQTEYPISIAVEINRRKAENDPGTDYENLIEICRRVDNPKIGIGWDLGHTYYNVSNSFIPKEPPREFVERVVHTHIHDVNDKGQTHWPLVMGNLPLDFYLQKLKAAGYNRYYTLELYPERFIDTLSADKAMLESIQILKGTSTTD